MFSNREKEELAQMKRNSQCLIYFYYLHQFMFEKKITILLLIYILIIKKSKFHSDNHGIFFRIEKQQMKCKKIDVFVHLNVNVQLC